MTQSATQIAAAPAEAPDQGPQAARRLAVIASYVCHATDVIELPEGRSWADVASHGLKWDRWFVTYHDGTEDEFDFHYEIDTGAIDTKRPDYEVYPAREDGSPDFDAILGDG